MTITIYVMALLAILFALWLTGRRWMVSEIETNARASENVIRYHNDLVRYAESRGEDDSAMGAMMMASTKIERILSGDNWIAGARVVRNIYNGVPAIPFAIREIHECIRDHLWQRQAFQAVELVRSILVRHIGRRNDEIDQLTEESKYPLKCIAIGWKLWTAVPLYFLSGIGLMKGATVRRARKSKVFALYSLILFLTALAGPIIAYLADKDKIDEILIAGFPHAF